VTRGSNYAGRTGAKTKFVIFGEGRSGSTLLAALLNSHPEVRCERELLNHENGYLRNGPLLWALRFAPYPFMALRAARAPASAYGFKLMVGHVHQPRLTLNVLRLLGWKIVHIHREDIVQQALSELVAKSTGRWQRPRSEPATSPRIRVAREDFVDEIRKRLRSRVIEQRALAGIAHHRVVYEHDLADAASWPRTSSALCRYLGLEERALTARLRKVYDESYEQIVENYAELVEAARAVGAAG
jgi:LPS sulfotransferase NodH